MLRNAFIQALIPSVDNEINLRSVDKAKEKDDRNLFQKIFSSGDKSDKSKKKEKKANN